MKKIHFHFPVLFLLFLGQQSNAQFIIPGFGKQTVIGGYEKNVEGEILPYFSSYQQFAKEALLTRCTDGNKIITWQSAVVPADFKNDYGYFYFLAGHSTGTSTADRHFDFFINGEKCLTFITPQKKKLPFSWSFTGNDSVQLVFNANLMDIHANAHGDLFLKVPKKMIVPGKSVTFSIKGQKENSNDWFMIFRYPYVEKIIVEPSPLLVQTKKGIKQLIRIKCDHTFTTEDTLVLKLFCGEFSYILKPGFNYFELPVDTVDKAHDDLVTAKVSNKFEQKISVHFAPVHRREVDIIHHSHNDIGYSHFQEDVARIQVENIKSALSLIRKTQNYPEGSRFVWNVESVWGVDRFLNEATEDEKQNFFDAVRKKQIGLSGHYANILTGLCTPEELDWITERAVQLRSEHHLPMSSVMLTDIPGVSWSEVQSLADHGFRYFSNGPNYQPQFPDRGERIGRTILDYGDKPFYWLGENGKSKILFWTAGRGYSMFHMIPFADLDEKRKDKLVDYMNELDSTNYPYDIVQLRYNIKTDNGPTDSTLCDFVKSWNEKYISPKLNITTVDDMMERFERKYGKDLPEMSGDFTPYWEDGAYSTAKEEGEVRMVGEKIIQLQKLHRLNPAVNVDTNWFCLARRCVVMFQEHTWGSWNSVSDPDNPFTTGQWEYKKRFCDSAGYYVKQVENGFMSKEKNFSQFEMWNTLSWERSGYVEMNPPEGLRNFSIVDEKNSAIDYQKLSNGKICFQADHIPPSGKKTYRIVSFKKEPVPSMDLLPEIIMIIDSTNGSVKSLERKGIEWVDHEKYDGLNSALYVAGPDPQKFSSSTVRKIETIENGTVIRKERITCSLVGTNEVVYEITEYKSTGDLLFSVMVDKKAVREKESVHMAFPFKLKNVTTRIGIRDTFITPEHGQLSAANKDYYSVQRWIDVSEKDRGVTISSPQCALFEIGNMIDERRVNKGEKLWKRESKSSSAIFGYAMNNYWHTNYKADQSGVVRFDFYLHLHDTFSTVDAQHFGYEVNEPLLVVTK
ncbi:MAG: hypothetical protein NT126_05180 [Bacteroidetes bacterium]|nr:hypothetical protein [Bacteroidota bacterium]